MAACSYTDVFTIPCIEQNDTFEEQPFLLEVGGVAADLTDATIVLTLTNGNGSLTTVDSGGLTITDASNGLWKIDTQIITFTPKLHNYETVFTFSDGSVKTYMAGTWEVKK